MTSNTPNKVLPTCSRQNPRIASALRNTSRAAANYISSLWLAIRTVWTHRRNRRLANKISAGKRELATALKKSPLRKWTLGELKRAAEKRPDLATACRAEIKGRTLAGVRAPVRKARA